MIISEQKLDDMEIMLVDQKIQMIGCYQKLQKLQEILFGGFHQKDGGCWLKNLIGRSEEESHETKLCL